MNANLSDRQVLLAVSPMALSAYARTSGWAKTEAYGDHSDVYTGPSLPEIIVPRTRQLGDYAMVVARLISIFTQAAEVGEATLYNDLVTSDRDVVRMRVSDTDGDGGIDLDSGARLVNGTRDLVLAAACSLHSPRPLYRPGAHQEANDFLRQAQLGPTERGSFIVTLLTPVIPPPLQEPLFPDLPDADVPTARMVTRRLGQGLDAARRAVGEATRGDATAFPEAVASGVSANLCEALADMIEPFAMTNISVTWARTRPLTTTRQAIGFVSDDVPILREAARAFRSREPRPNERLFGYVRILRRDESVRDGTITMRAPIDGTVRSVTATLTQSDYDRAIGAHKSQVSIIVDGDLERIGPRWHLHNPHIIEVISDEDDPDEGEQ